jgi:hypothetical protein
MIGSIRSSMISAATPNVFPLYNAMARFRRLINFVVQTSRYWANVSAILAFMDAVVNAATSGHPM